jgi:WhiB family redox-sensing transcriptional regulator
VRSTSQEQGWETRAACQNTGGASFYPTPHETSPQRAQREKDAKRICADCPVRVECLDYAINTQQPLGIWGGLYEAERLTLVRAIA